jgi:hypothetical protein
VFKIEELSESELTKIKQSNDFISSDEICISDKCLYLAVYSEEENNKIYAVFDIRDAIDYIKHMRIYYLKSLMLINTEAEIEDNAIVVFGVLIDIFRYLKDKADKIGFVKIYVNTDSEFLVFSLMARKLAEQEEGKFNIKIYKNWIELRRIMDL